MKYDYVIFDLDGTLLAIDDQAFDATYFKALTHYFRDLFNPDELISLIWRATKITVMDLSPRTNQSVFMEAIRASTSLDAQDMYQRFMAFYASDFDALQKVIQPNPWMLKAVEHLHQQGLPMAIATNPLFPRIAVEKRMAWAGLNPSYFSFVTSFEENHACKPQLMFYQEVLDRVKLEAAKTLMVGNDPLEDMIAGRLGMKTYLVTDYVVDRPGVEPMWDERGTMEEFYHFIVKHTSQVRN